MRHHFMDRLRVVMMLLGIVLHASLAYTTLPLDFWPYRDAASSRLLDVAAIFIHAFRMPLFLVVAGFFAHQQLESRGARGFARQRCARVAVPLLIGWALMFPFYAAVVAMSAAPTARIEALGEFVCSGRWWRQPTWIHLWFLYYLMQLYALTLLLRLPRLARWLAAPRRILLQIVAQPQQGLPVFVVLGGLAALTMRNGGLDPPQLLRPQLHILLACGLYYLFGWLLYERREALSQLQAGAMQRVIAAPLLLLGFLAYRRCHGDAADWLSGPLHVLAAAVWTAVAWLMIYGLLGLFRRYGNRPDPRWRALSESAYWMYLAHLPLVLWLALLFSGLALPALLKLVLVSGLTFVLLWLAWRHVVRDGLIGAVLEGRLTGRQDGRQSESLATSQRPARDG